MSRGSQVFGIHSACVISEFESDCVPKDNPFSMYHVAPVMVTMFACRGRFAEDSKESLCVSSSSNSDPTASEAEDVCDSQSED